MKKKIKITLYYILYDTGLKEIKFLDGKQLAGLKRSKQWKKVLSLKKLQEVIIDCKVFQIN